MTRRDAAPAVASAGLTAALSLLMVACTPPSTTERMTSDDRPVAASSRSFAPVVRQVSPAVVAIAAERIERSPLLEDPLFRRFFERYGPEAAPTRRQTSLGSGVVVDPAGLVVTNHHVVAEAAAIAVVLTDGRTIEARVLRSDPSSELAVLQVAASGLPAISFADSDRLRPGDFVLAVGNPFGIGQSVSSGIVSATERFAQGLGMSVPLIQTDAAINPGNSGGALVDVHGRLVGINTAILTGTGGSVGVGFAIPANAVRAYLDDGRSS